MASSLLQLSKALNTYVAILLHDSYPNRQSLINGQSNNDPV